MHYLTISFTHKNTSIEVREKLAFDSDEKLLNAYQKITDVKLVNELIMLSTCNRVEIITSVKEPLKAIEPIFKIISEITGVELAELEGRGDTYEDSGAIHHLFSVISSLDSLVIGETQIVGQLKDAFRFSYDNGFSSQKIARAMHHAFRCAARVRSTTNISKNPVSVSSVAVAKAKEIYGGNLGGFTALIVGAGEMSRLACEHLANNGVNLIIFNRDMNRAEKLAEQIDGIAQAKPFSDLKQYLNRYRLLFSATGAPYSVITKDMIEEVEFERNWFDIAVPRDIENFNSPSVNIHSVDDLKQIVNKNLELRDEESRVAYSIVGKATMEFFKWLDTLSVDPLIKEIRKNAKLASQKEIDRAISKGYIPAEHKKSVEKILHQAFNTFLHKPTTNLKLFAELPESDTIVQSMQKVFDLESEKAKTIDNYKCEYQIEKDLKK